MAEACGSICTFIPGVEASWDEGTRSECIAEPSDEQVLQLQAVSEAGGSPMDRLTRRYRDRLMTLAVLKAHLDSERKGKFPKGGEAAAATPPASPPTGGAAYTQTGQWQEHAELDVGHFAHTGLSKHDGSVGSYDDQKGIWDNQENYYPGDMEDYEQSQGHNGRYHTENSDSDSTSSDSSSFVQTKMESHFGFTGPAEGPSSLDFVEPSHSEREENSHEVGRMLDGLMLQGRNFGNSGKKQAAEAELKRLKSQVDDATGRLDDAKRGVDSDYTSPSSFFEQGMMPEDGPNA